MVKKEEYKLTDRYQKEADFVNEVLVSAQKLAGKVVSLASDKENYEKLSAKATMLKEAISSVGEKYKNNLVALQQNQDAVVELGSKNTLFQANLQRTEATLASERKRASTLESKVIEVNEANEVLKTDGVATYKKYQEADKLRSKYESDANKYHADLAVRTVDLFETQKSLASSDVKVMDLSDKASKRVSAVQTLLQTYFGVPESTFKGVAENKKEDHVYKLLEEQLSARDARDKQVDKELEEALGFENKEEKPAPVQKSESTLKNIARVRLSRL